uniref:Putative ovule protein n=1 Tax=Solanum chacoense TaxID=4108 RepID=A0A0V0HJV1_SOLCH
MLYLSREFVGNNLSTFTRWGKVCIHTTPPQTPLVELHWVCCYQVWKKRVVYLLRDYTSRLCQACC